MAKTIYVGNLPFNVTEDDVRDLFAQFGEVTSVKFIKDRETGRFRGFGFVIMNAGVDEAIRELDNKEFGGRALRVNEAKERPARGGDAPHTRRRSPYGTA